MYSRLKGEIIKVSHNSKSKRGSKSNSKLKRHQNIPPSTQRENVSKNKEVIKDQNQKDQSVEKKIISKEYKITPEDQNNFPESLEYHKVINIPKNIHIVKGKIKKSTVFKYEHMEEGKRSENTVRNTTIYTEENSNEKRKSQGNLVNVSKEDYFETLQVESVDIVENQNDIYTWKIENFDQLKYDADKNGKVSLSSDPFYTNLPGYKMCLIFYPFGDYTSRGSYLSVYFVIMKGDYDNELEWPFKDTVSVSLLDQEDGNEPFTRKIKPPPESVRFKKPTGLFNEKVGWMKFYPLTSLTGNSKYCKGDTIFLKIFLNSS